MKRQIEQIINIIIYSPLWIYFNILGYKKIGQEAIIWNKILPIPKFNSKFLREIWLLGNLSEFRSLLFFRYKTYKFNILKWLYPGTPNLYIPYSQKIGHGLIIQHGFSTIFNAEKIGHNCQVWHCVTIGKAHSGLNMPRPTIGNNVKICCNATILGGITIGDNVTIGAASVITKSVPSNCTVVGNPAKIIIKEGKRVNIPL